MCYSWSQVAVSIEILHNILYMVYTKCIIIHTVDRIFSLSMIDRSVVKYMKVNILYYYYIVS